MWRLQVVLGHLSGRPELRPAPQAARCLGVSPRASAGDVVVVHGRRTAIGKAGRGGFKVRPPGPRPLSSPGRAQEGGLMAVVPPSQDTTPDELLSAVMTAVLQDVKLRPEQLGDICVGEPRTLPRLCRACLALASWSGLRGGSCTRTPGMSLRALHTAC